jgi:hypothetical protein
MPTLRPRINVTLKPSLFETIRRLSAFQKLSMSRVISELLREIEPVLQSTVVALEQLQSAKGKPAAALLTAMTRMQGAVEQLSQNVTGQIDFLRPQPGPLDRPGENDAYTSGADSLPARSSSRSRAKARGAAQKVASAKAVGALRAAKRHGRGK